MAVPDRVSKLPKLPFLVGDAAFLAAAWLIVDRAGRPLDSTEILAIVGCVVCGAVCGVIPFLADYSRRENEALDDRQRGLEALAHTIGTSAEQISIAAHGLQEIAEEMRRSAHEATEAARAEQKEAAELAEQEDEMAAREERFQELTERLETAADKIAKAAGRDEKAEKIARRLEAAAENLAKDIAERPKAEAKPSPPPEPKPAEPAPEPPPPAEAVVEPPPPKPRKHKAPPPPPVEEPPRQEEFSQIVPEEAAPPPSVSTDGATRLIVTAYIGIGNRLFVRGEGPGLSWDQGVPLQFVSIGKWKWESADAAAPIRYKLYKNDEAECTALGEKTLEAGQQQEVTASF